MTLLKRLRYVDISKYMKQIEFGKFFFYKNEHHNTNNTILPLSAILQVQAEAIEVVQWKCKQSIMFRFSSSR